MWFCVDGKVPILFWVPVETGDVSWWHDRRQGVGSCAARMRERGTGTNGRLEGLSRGQARLPLEIQIASGRGNKRGESGG